MVIAAGGVPLATGCASDDPSPEEQIDSYCRTGCQKHEECGGSEDPAQPCMATCIEQNSGWRERCPEEVDSYLACGNSTTWMCVEGAPTAEPTGCTIEAISACLNG
jgi:hypothetical protein